MLPLSEKIGGALPYFTDLHVNSFSASILGLCAGAGGLFVVMVMGTLLFRREAMGYGDVKLMAFIGAILGWEGVLVTFIIACLAGTIIGIPSKLLSKNSYLPFGPYLAIGAACTLFFKPEILEGFKKYLSLFAGI